MQEKLENKQNNISNHVFFFPPFVCMSQVKNITGCGRNEVYHLIFSAQIQELYPCSYRVGQETYCKKKSLLLISII